MIRRLLQTALRRAAAQYPVVTLTGPRQSGKTTLARAAFPRHRYVSLEDPDDGRFAREDPRGFLQQFLGPVILDEVQRAPDLFSYIQTMVDESEKPGHFILSGSQNFLLLQKVSQSLAGRCAILHLLPFSMSELAGRKPFPVSELGRPFRGREERPVRPHGCHVSGVLPEDPRQGTGAPAVAERLLSDLRPERRTRHSQRRRPRGLRAIRPPVRWSQRATPQPLLARGGLRDHAHTARRWISILEASFLDPPPAATPSQLQQADDQEPQALLPRHRPPLLPARNPCRGASSTITPTAGPSSRAWSSPS